MAVPVSTPTNGVSARRVLRSRPAKTQLAGLVRSSTSPTSSTCTLSPAGLVKRAETDEGIVPGSTVSRP